MTVLSYNKAATRAGVSRQRITKLKRDHLDKKSMKTYFVFNPDNGKEGINIDDPSWKNYENKNNLKRVNKKKIDMKQNSKHVDQESINNAIKKFAIAVRDASREQFGLNDKDLKKFAGLIEIKYEGME